MARNYYYVINVNLNQVLTTAGTGLVVSPKLTPKNNSQLWFMDEITNSYIQSLENGRVLERQTVGPPNAYWVNLVEQSSNSRQRWDYTPAPGWIENYGSLEILDIWGGSTVICSFPIRANADAAAATTGVNYIWQLQVAGQVGDEEATFPVLVEEAGADASSEEGNS